MADRAEPISAVIETKLVDTLFADPSSILIGCIAVVAISVFCYLRTGQTWLFAWTLFALVVATGRLLVFRAYRRRTGPPNPRRWSNLCMAGTTLNSIGWGAASATAVLHSDLSVQLLVISGQIAYVADAGVRNNAVQRVALTQIMVPIVFLFAACIATLEPYHLFYAFCVFMSFLAAAKSNRHLCRQTRDLVVAREEAAKAVDSLEDANRLLAALATTDALTGAANRRGFDAALDTECARALRAKTPLSLLLLDIDHFKKLNDHFGHQSGDECLRRFGRCLETICRAGDLIARYGGEEFAVLLPATGGAGASLMAERARAAIQSLAIPHPTSVSQVTTVSVGYATACGAAELSASVLIKRADDALYRAKAAGRNVIRGAEHDPADRHAALQPERAIAL